MGRARARLAGTRKWDSGFDDRYGALEPGKTVS
ncbi:hypothetical protein BH23ACT6_BH23ACT6_10060 [soil metagenome]